MLMTTRHLVPRHDPCRQTRPHHHETDRGTFGVGRFHGATLALVMRAAAMRELGNFTAALEGLKEALRFPSRSPDVRHRARYERALVYLAQGQKRKAREELERIYAENSSLPHVNQALGELNG